MSKALTIWQDEQRLKVYKNAVAPKLNDMEFRFAIEGLIAFGITNPHLKEVIPQLFISRDGERSIVFVVDHQFRIRKAQESGRLIKYDAGVIYSKDEFSADLVENTVSHKITCYGKERGQVVGGWCIVIYRDGAGNPARFLALAEYGESVVQRNPLWTSHPGEMMWKAIIGKALKKIFPLGGSTAVDDVAVYRTQDGVIDSFAGQTVFPDLPSIPAIEHQKTEFLTQEMKEALIKDLNFAFFDDKEVIKKQLSEIGVKSVSSIANVNQYMKVKELISKYMPQEQEESELMETAQ